MNAIAVTVHSIHSVQEKGVHALRPQCRKACIVADIVHELISAAEANIPNLDVSVQILVKALGDLERVVSTCGTHPVRARLFAQPYVEVLKVGTEHIRDAATSFAGIVADPQLAEARDELDEIIKAFATFHDTVGEELQHLVGLGDDVAVVSRLVRDGACADEEDARAQLRALQAEVESILSSGDEMPEDCMVQGQTPYVKVQVLRDICNLSVLANSNEATCNVGQSLQRKPRRRWSTRGPVPTTESGHLLVMDGSTSGAPPDLEPSGPQIPDHFKCPITLEMMHDPVFLFTQAGRSFERTALEQWLSHHPTVDPLTNEMHATLLEYAPNRVLRDVIYTWCREHELPDPQQPQQSLLHEARSTLPENYIEHASRSDSSAVAMRSPEDLHSDSQLLAHDFPLTGAYIHRLAPEYSDSEREAAARALIRKCDEAEEEGDVTREIRHAGGISALVLALSSDRVSASLQEAAAIALWKVSRMPRENRVVIANARAIPPLVKILASLHTTILSKQAAAGILQNLSCYSANYKVAIANAGAIRPLVKLISLDPVASHQVDGVREDAARCLWSIAVNEQKKIDIANAGAIAPLVRLVAEGSNDGVREAGAGALQNLAANNSENKVAIVAAGAIEPLVRLVTNGNTDGAKEAASGALQNLAKYNEANKTAIVCAGAIPPLAEVVGDTKWSDKAKRTAARALENLAWNNDAYKVAIANSGAVSALVSLLQNNRAAFDAREAAAEALKVLTRSRQARSKIAKALGFRYFFTPSEAEIDEYILSRVRSP